MTLAFQRLVAAGAALLLAGGTAAQPTPAGLWKTFGERSAQPEALVRIVELGGRFEGTVEKVFSPPAPSDHPLCEACPGELRNRPVVGLTILRGLRRDGEQYVGGEILDPDDGTVYRCTARLLEGGAKLGLRGYVGLPLLGRSQVWVRHGD
jgi:uncharacterized protein (DUF2147 family)